MGLLVSVLDSFFVYIKNNLILLDRRRYRLVHSSNVSNFRAINGKKLVQKLFQHFYLVRSDIGMSNDLMCQQ